MADSPVDPTADREWLVNQIAHALRNPIFAATVQTEALHLRAGDPAAVIKTAEALHGQLQRLSQSINEMLLFGRPIRPSYERVSVAELAATLVNRYHNGDRQEPAEISADPIDPDLDGHWDRIAVLVILERILDNAVQHTDAPHEIRLAAGATNDGAVEFRISDGGAGIPPDILERALLPFFPQHSGRPGLGLAIADKFARFFGGSIEIETVPGSGTIVRCILPQKASGATAG
jgi:signal transduction histidine kinase